MISGDPNHHCLHITHTSPKPNVRSRAVAGWMRLDFCDCVLKYYCLPIHKSVFVYTCTRRAICAMCDVPVPSRRRAVAREEREREKRRRGEDVGFLSSASASVGFRASIPFDSVRTHRISISNRRARTPGCRTPARRAKDGRRREGRRRQRVSLGVATTTTDDA